MHFGEKNYMGSALEGHHLRLFRPADNEVVLDRMHLNCIVK